MADRRRAPYNSKHSTSNRTSSRGRSTSTSRSGNSRTSGTRTSAKVDRANPYKPSSKYITNVIIGTLIVILVIAGVTAGLIYSNVKYLYDDTTIVPGVAISGINVGGMTREQAFNELNRELNNRINSLSITLNFNGQTWNYDSSNIQTTGDITSALDQVMLYGHIGTVQERMSEAEYVLKNDEQLNIVFGYDEASIRQIVETLSQDLNVAPIEPTIDFDDTAGKITNIEDVNALLYNPLKYDNAFSVNGEMAGVVWENGIPVVKLLDENGEPTIDNEIFTYTDGQDGYYVDVDATTAAIMTDLADDYTANVDIATVAIQPEQSKSDLQEYTSLVYHSKSKLVSSSTTARDINVATAVGAFDGLVLYPGDIISFNETTGERSAENGYQLAHVINQDKSVTDDYGGGVCQAATVIFNAALMSGCTILERNSHSWPSYYESYNFGEEARDAMVNWGTSDVVFKNTTDYPIYFDTYCHWTSEVNVSHAYCNVYTKLLPEGQYIDCESQLIKNEAPADPIYEALTDYALYADREWKLDSATGLLVYTYNKPKNEKIYEVYRYIKDEAGQEVFKEKVYIAHYQAIQGKYYTKPVDAKATTDADAEPAT